MTGPYVLEGPLFEPWLMVLLHFTWQAIAIAAIWRTGLALIGNGRPTARYNWSLVGLAAMIAAPFITFVLVIQNPLPERIAGDSSTAQARNLESGRTGAIAETTREPIRVDSMTSLGEWTFEQALAIEQSYRNLDRLGTDTTGTVQSNPTLPNDDKLSSELIASTDLTHRFSSWNGLRQTGYDALALMKRHQAMLLLVWIVGSVAFSMRLGTGSLICCRLRANKLPLSPEIQAVVTDLSKKLHLSSERYLVWASHRVSEAIALGIYRPVILIPMSWLHQLPPETIQAVLAHELSHLRRYDLVVNLVQRVLETVFFFHPAVWWISNQVRFERECCCDRLAVNATGDRASYAKALADVAQLRLDNATPSLVTSIFGGKRMSLLKRVQCVLGRPSKRRLGMSSVAGVSALVLVVTLTTMTLFAQQDQDRPRRDNDNVRRPQNQDRVRSRSSDRARNDNRDNDRAQSDRRTDGPASDRNTNDPTSRTRPNVDRRDFDQRDVDRRDVDRRDDDRTNAGRNSFDRRDETRPDVDRRDMERRFTDRRSNEARNPEPANRPADQDPNTAHRDPRTPRDDDSVRDRWREARDEWFERFDGDRREDRNYNDWVPGRDQPNNPNGDDFRERRTYQPRNANNNQTEPNSFQQDPRNNQFFEERRVEEANRFFREERQDPNANQNRNSNFNDFRGNSREDELLRLMREMNSEISQLRREVESLRRQVESSDRSSSQQQRYQREPSRRSNSGRETVPGPMLDQPPAAEPVRDRPRNEPAGPTRPNADQPQRSPENARPTLRSRQPVDRPANSESPQPPVSRSRTNVPAEPARSTQRPTRTESAQTPEVAPNATPGERAVPSRTRSDGPPEVSEVPNVGPAESTTRADTPAVDPVETANPVDANRPNRTSSDNSNDAETADNVADDGDSDEEEDDDLETENESNFR